MFKQRFLVASREIMVKASDSKRALADKLVKRIEQEGRLRKRRKEEGITQQ